MGTKPRIVGIIPAIIVIVIGGFFTGELVGLVGQTCYLIILFPIVICVVGVIILGIAVRLGRIRDAIIGIGLGLLLGLLIVGTYRYYDYALARQDYIDQNPTKNFDNALQAETGHTGIVGYYIFRARQGDLIRINGSQIVLPEIITWAYWIVEAVIIIGFLTIAGRMMIYAFCKKHQRYFEKSTVGRVESTLTDFFIAAVKAGNWREAATMINRTGDVMVYPIVLVNIAKCPVCNTNPLPLTVTYCKSGAVRDRDVRLTKTITPEQYNELKGTPSTSNDFREQFVAARGFIVSRNYPAARQILQGIDHPRATEWLRKLDQAERGEL